MDLFVLTCLLATIGITISATEDIRLRGELFTRSIFDWRYCLAFQSMRPRQSSRFYDTVFGVTSFRLITGLKAASCAAALTLALFGYPAYIPLTVALACHLFMFYRLSYSVDGADQMMIIVLAGLIVMDFGRQATCYRDLGAAFIALHTAVAYLTSGMTKAFSLAWRSGAGFRGVMATGAFGSAALLKVLDMHRHNQVVLSYLIFGGQIAIGTMILAGSRAAIGAVALALLFHISVAAVMRLNLFVWAFGATFPSIIWMSDWGVRIRFVSECFLR